MMTVSEQYLKFLATMMPAAWGTVFMVYSAVHCLFIMNKPRYAMKNFSHPYKPWTEEQSDEKAYRGVKAHENIREWLTYVLPLYFFLVLFSPVFPSVAGFDLGKFFPWASLSLALAYSYANVVFMKGYMESAANRMPGFRLRTLCFKIILFCLLATFPCTIARIWGYSLVF